MRAPSLTSARVMGWRGVGRSLVARLLVCVALSSVGCGVGAEDQARTIPSDKLPPALASGSSTSAVPTTSAGTVTQPVELWFIRDDGLVPVLRSMRSTVDPAEVLRSLVQGPGAGGAGLRSALVDADLFRTVSRSGGVAVVDLDDSFSSLPSGEQLLGAGQVVCTLTSLPGVGMVSFRVGGDTVDVPIGDGTQSRGPVSRDDYRPLLPDGG